jgi:hypothetical protein
VEDIISLALFNAISSSSLVFLFELNIDPISLFVSCKRERENENDQVSLEAPLAWLFGGKAIKRCRARAIIY